MHFSGHYLIAHMHYNLLFLPSDNIAYRCLSGVNQISFHKSAVVPNMKSNDRTIMQWYLPPTICPFPFPKSSPFIYYFVSLYMF